MTVSFVVLLTAAWRQFRREQALIWPIAGLFVFVPAFAAMLLSDPIPPMPPAPRDTAVMNAWLDAVTTWGQANLWWYVAADLFGVFGIAAIAILLLDPRGLSVGEAMAATARRLMPFVVVDMVTAIPVGLGLWLFVLPGLYAQARLIAAVPMLAARPDLGGLEALRSSLRVTRGAGMAITAALVSLFLLQWLSAVPLLSADEGLRAAGNDNPLLLSLVDALVTLAAAAYHVAALLIGLVFYRARASKGI